MTWQRRVRPAMFVLGVALIAATLVGARALTAGHGQGGEQKSANPAAAAPAKAGGPIVMGTVDSNPPPVEYRLPPVLQSGTVARVAVGDTQEVKAGDELYAFDTSIQQRDVERAKIDVKRAENEVAKAREGKKTHEAKVGATEAVLESAKRSVDLATTRYNLTKSNLERGFKASGQDPKEWPKLLAESPDLFKAHADYVDALGLRDKIQSELNILKATDVDLLVKQAEIAVEQAKAEQRKAETVVELCTVRARTAGRVEQVKISPGATIGVGTRDPALWLIPGGKRVVRAEVEAEFAHRVSDALIGKEVTIHDHSDPKLTYTGVVKRIGETFLPKRSVDGLLGTDTRVLECLVEVPDSAPAGKPPLRVGQRVRVNLGQ